MAVQAGRRFTLRKDSLSVAVSATETITIQDLVDFKSQKYLVTIIDPATSKVKYLEHVVINDEGNIKDIIFGKFGAKLDLAINAVANSGKLDLNYTNNEAFDLDVCVTRINIS